MPLTHYQKLLRATTRAAKHYDDHAQLAQTIAERLITRLAYLRIKPHTILDLGCGTTYLASLLKKQYHNATVLAVDISLAMLQQNSSPTLIVAADAHQLPFADHSIDLICSTFLLEWSQDLIKLLAEVKRVLTPSGIFLFATLGPSTLTELKQTWHAITPSNHVNAFCDMHDMGDILLTLKFANPVMDREDFTLLYPDITTLLKELKQLGSIKTLTNQQNTLTSKTTFKKLTTTYPRNSDQYYPATFEIIYGYAFGSYASLSDEQAGISRFPLDKIERRK